MNIGDFINPAYAALNQLTGTNRFPTNVDATLPLKQETKLRTTLPLFNGALFANLDAARAVQGLRGAERGAALRRLDAESRIVSFEEKPDEPASTLAGIALYYYPRETLPLIDRKSVV